MLNTKLLVQQLNKMMKKSTAAKEARIQIKLPRGEFRSPDGYFDVVKVSMMENNVLGQRESHRIVFEIYPEKMGWRMGKPKLLV
jgi:hypothetical protein